MDRSTLATMCRYIAVIFAVLVMSIGQVWGTDLEVPLNEIRVLPTQAGLVKIAATGTNSSNVTTSSGDLVIKSNTTGTFTIYSTNTTRYKIKSISFTTNHTPGAFQCTDTEPATDLSGSGNSWSYTPASPVNSAAFTFTSSGSSTNLDITVTLTTSSTDVVERLHTFTKTESTFGFSSSAATTQIELTDESTGEGTSTATAVSNYRLQCGKGTSKTYSLKFKAKTGYVLKFISFYFYDSPTEPGSGTTTFSSDKGTYTSSSYTWNAANSTTSEVVFTICNKNTNKYEIHNVYVGYVAAASDTYYLCSDFSGEWTETQEITPGSYVDVSLPEASYLKYKIKKVPSAGDATWYGRDGSADMERANCTDWTLSSSGSDCYVRTDIAGTYRFAMSLNGSGVPVMTVTYPTGVAVTLNMNGGGDPDTWQAYTDGVIPVPGYSPSRDGYAFDGWYADAEGTEPWVWSTTVSSATTLYAKWSNAWYYAEEDDSWKNHVMTRSAGASYWYREASKKAATRQFKIQRNGTWYDCRQSSPGYMCTDVTNMNKSNNNFGLSDNRAGVYNNDNDYKILVFPPNTPANTTDDPIICASTSLPEDYYSLPSGRTIYFDNSEAEWSNIYFRKGRDKCAHNEATALTKVPGTDNLYKLTTAAVYDGYQAFHLANNCSWTGDNSIYRVNGDGYAITKALEFQKYNLDEDVTFTPGATRDLTDGCQYYVATKTSGMKTDRVTISDYSNGTITVNYTNTSGSAATLTSGSADLAHTVILTSITATPATGYEIDDDITINEDEYSANYVVTGPTTIAASFKLKNYNVTYSAPSNGNYTINVADGGASSATKTATMGQTVAIVATPADASYEFTGWTVTNTSSSADVTSTLLAGDKATTASTSFTMPAYEVTIVATFAKKTYTVTYNKGTGDITGSHANDTKTHGVNLTLPGATFSKTGYTQTGWATEDGGSQAYALSASYTANAAANLYPVWTANKFDVTHTLSHVTRSSGGQAGENKATYGTEYSVVFAADGGYTLPATVTVTIGGAAQTAGTGYTWNQGTGTLTIPAAYVTGDIVITVTGEEETCTPINASVVFDNNKSAKYDASWGDGDVATSGSASWAKNSIGSDTGHPMTKPAMKLDDTGDYIKITLPSGVATGTITVLACTYSGKTGTLIINDENNSTTPLASEEVGLNGEAQTYKINSPNGESWTAPTLKTVSYNITSGGDYYIKQSAGNSIYVFAFSATGVKECACTIPAAPTAFSAGSITSTGATFSITDAANAASYDIYYSTSSDAPTASTPATTTSTSKTKAVTGLTASTTYYAWVRSVCDEDHKSSWVAASSFTTSAPPTYTLTASATVSNPMTADSKTGTITGSFTNNPVTDITSGTTTSTSSNTFTVNKGTPVTVTAAATIAGTAAQCDECTYVFDHWENIPASVTADVSTIHAIYKTTYSISFKETDETDVTGISASSYDYGVGKDASTLPTPTKSGYTFDGWYDNTLENLAEDIGDDAWGNITYYAKWTAAPAGTTYYLVTSTAQLNTTDTYVIMDDGKAAMMGVYGSDAMTAITSGFTAAADKSTVTVSSSDVNTLTLQAESSAWNIVGKDDKKLTTNSTIGAKLFGNTPKATEDSKDDFVFSFADGKATIKRNTETNYHIYYSSGTGFNQSTSSTNIRLYTSNSTPVYTVTYNLNGGTGTVPTHRAEKSGTSITLASSAGLTKSGYTFDGWLCSANSTKYAAGASYTMTAVNTTFTAQWVAVSGYTVTYNYNGATGGATPASATGASVTLPTPTRTDYELDGWYTTAGEKVGAGGATYNPTADITLYARWEAECDAGGVAKSTTDVPATGYTTYIEKGGSNVVFTSAPSIGFKYKDADGNTINNSTTSAVRNNAYKCQISSDSGNKGSIKTNSTFSNVDSISFYFAASDKSGCKIAVWCSTDNFSTDSTSLLPATTYADNKNEFKLKTLAIPSGKKASALRFKFRFTVTSSGKTSYIDSLKVYSSTSGSGTCYHVYYHGNGAESGFVSDTTSYSDGAKATVLSYNDSRYPLTKEDNDFQGWATSAGGSVAYTAGQKITIDGADVNLYAKWATASSALVNWTMGTNTSTWSATATSTTDGTNISSIGTARTSGNDGEREGATAKVTMATAEVTGSAAPSSSANFTFTIGATKQVEISKFDCKVFNVSDGNRTYKAQISDAAGNVYNSTNTVPVTASATLTDASFVFGSGKILRGAVTIRIYAWKTSGSPTDFRMGPDVKFYGTVDNYACATPSAPTISGVSEYVPGQTITLTASHDGENYDNLTTYTWYQGANWAAASGTTPVQAAATGSAGYTFTKASCAAGDAGKYWCKVSNGTGCDAHNSEGYNIIVYPTYTITYNLNGGTNPVDPAPKTSYTRYDEDYTLPVPSKDGFVFAGWYQASDFSGLPISTLESGSVGDREYWAKWGSAVTATWTVTKVDDKLYRGGGSYSVKAVIDQTTWNDSYKDQLELTATEGVTLKNIVASVVSTHVQVTADFDITTGLAADATEITFTLDVPADGTYASAELSHDEDLTSCAGSSTVWDFTTNDFLNGGTWSTSGGAENKAYATDGTTILKYYAGGSSDEWDSSNEQLKTHGTTTTSSGTGIKNLTQKYFFFPTLSGKGTISVVYGTTNSTLKIYEATSTNIYGLDPIITLTSSSPTSSTYTFSSDKKYYMTMESNKVYFKRITFTASSGGITPTLTWDPALADDGDWSSDDNRLNKETGDVDFTFVANQNKNSLGAITYESSNTSVATVNAAGTVHIVGAAGNATITATLAASGCFEEATATYNIQVEDNCIDNPGTIAWTDLGCSGIQMTVSGHTTSGENVSYQWYKVGTPDEAISGATEATFTATEAGEYYVVVTNTGTDHCAMASTNTIKVAAKAAISVPTNIVDSWYVKNGRRTPDIALWKTTGVSTFTVKNNASGATIENIGGCTFELKDGIIYLKGTTSTGAAPSDMETGDLVIKAEVKDECGSNTKISSTITIHCQAATNYKEIAFVADGGKGMRKDSITVGHGDGTELYEYLDSVGTAAENRLFKLSERNIYWTTDEKAIREEYSQFDAILITDDPSTNKVPNKEDYKTKGYVNAFGTMIDVRPIFTMEAYVSALKNWGSKGIAGNPQSPNPRQYEMRLECKDHEIYGSGLPDPEDGTNVWEEVIDGETFRHVILVDSTKGIYNGVAYNVETKGNEKPALQGFTGEAAGSLLGLGRILEGTLQAAIERQEEPAARLLVFGINAKALHETCALTDEGKVVIRNILTYLLKTNMEEVDDCSNYFKGGTVGKERDWNTASNWAKNTLPTYETKVRILAPCEISNAQVRVAQVDIATRGTSSNIPGGTCSGQLTIMADGALVVGGKVRTAEAPYFAANDLKPTTVNDLIINTDGSGQGALIFDNSDGDTKATVNLYSLGRKSDGHYQFQYYAVPMTYIDVNPAFAGSGIYTYVWNEASGWERRGYYTGLEAFEGVGITTKFADARTYQMKGTLASTATKEITLTHEDEGYNLIGNSWTAPIQISKLEADNSSLSNKTVYIYNAGNDTVGGGTEGSSPGQWTAIPFSAAGFGAWSGLKVIPAMQAFELVPTSEETLTLDYDKVVRGDNKSLTEPLHAPRRVADHAGIELMRIRVADSNTHTDLHLFEGEQFSEEFDNGWEAAYLDGDDGTTKLYADVTLGRMAVVATNELEGTILGFAPGQETTYTFSFGGAGMGYYLNDLKLKTSTLINAENSYTFTFEEGDTNRFYISSTPIEAPQTPTGVDNTHSGEVKAQKFIYNDKMYIMINGRVYSAEGQMVK